jgi:hypothetical protein
MSELVVAWDKDAGAYVPTADPEAMDANMAAAMARKMRENEEELERLGAWYQSNKARLEKSTAFAQSMLETYAKNEAAKSGLKSFPVGIATVTVKKAAATTHWTEDGTDWMLDIVGLERFRRESVTMDKNEVKKVIEWTEPNEDGTCEAALAEDVPGVGAKGDILPGLVKNTHPGEVKVTITMPKEKP